VPFHVEIAGSLNHARAFNLSAEELRRSIVGPWLSDLPVFLGEREWEPRESSLRILEGPHLEPPDLSFGQGWANAERLAEDVTRRELERTAPTGLPDAFIVESELPEATVAEMLSGQSAQPIEWGRAVRSVDGRDPEIAAVIIVTKR
jgi:hypothetical protein